MAILERKEKMTRVISKTTTSYPPHPTPPPSAKPVPDVNMDKVKQTDDLITAEIRITKFFESFSASYGRVCSLPHILGFSVICAKLVVRIRTESMKE